jgi:hypothetical protein
VTIRHARVVVQRFVSAIPVRQENTELIPQQSVVPAGGERPAVEAFGFFETAGVMQQSAQIAMGAAGAVCAPSAAGTASGNGDDLLCAPEPRALLQRGEQRHSSFQVPCETQQQADYYWERLSEGGDEQAQQCGWLKDKYGVSWQVFPKELIELVGDPDSENSQRAMKAMLQMKKIDIERIRQAYQGESAI